MSITPLMPVYPRCDVRPVRGEGCYLIGERGERYLDFASGIAVNALGHGHPHLVKAIAEQAATLMHVSNLYGSPQGEAFAQRIVDNSFADTVFFTNSGAEAVECAIKTARRYHFANGNPQRHKLITFKNAFHGRTLGTISATDQPKMRDGFEPLLPGFDYVAFNDLETALSKIDDETAGFLVETVQGEGGLTAGKPEFIKGLREAADKHGLLLVLDEVQCGYGRTGKFFAHEHYGVKPDVMAVAKGIGGGFPLGACLATEEAAKGMVFGTHGSTYGGNPLAMAAGMAVLQTIREEGLQENALTVGRYLMEGLASLSGRYPAIGDVRGSGLFIGVEIVADPATKTPDAALTTRIVNGLRERRILISASGPQANVLKIRPPLVFSRENADMLVDGLAEVLKAL